LSGRITQPLLALGLLGAAGATGAWVMWLAGASLVRWAGHLAACVVGLVVYAAVIRSPRFSLKVPVAAAVIGTIVIAFTLAAPGLQGVHRWLIVLGVRLHASQLVMPGLLVFAATNVRSSPALVQGLLLATQGIHLLQPDAGQASSVAAAALVLFLSGPSNRMSQACAAASLAAATATWMRFDPLQPAPFVEDIVPRAFAVSWWLGCLGLTSITAAALAPMTLAHQAITPAATLATRALTVYFVVAALVTVFGRFPVPLFGFGASSVLGAFFGLAALRRAGAQGSPIRIATAYASLDAPRPADLGLEDGGLPNSGLQQTPPSRSLGRRC
jgi:hypothetical protein